MYIKQLTVHGFKSYRDETIFGPFSSNHNVIVGRNGSGKSNFFAAIRFVLHDAYTKLGQEERQALLHEGGSAHLSAYVEIVFDNAIGRFPTGLPTTTIRRTVGLKKDEFSIDGKGSTKTDLMNMLQAAGFSKSNPYYIVPQGRVTALTVAKDEERLALLKEVAGTRTYEEHRQESLKILQETASKREKIGELLVFIRERLAELEEEREELSAYQEVEKERRCIEYILQHRELVQVGEELERLENENVDLMQDNSAKLASFDEQVKQISAFEAQLEDLKRELQDTEQELALEEEEIMQLRQGETRLQLDLNEHQANISKMADEEAVVVAKLVKVDVEIEDKENKLAAIVPQLKEARSVQEDVQAQIANKDQRREALLVKQGRGAQFRSAAERDKWIRKELETLEATVTLKRNQVSSLEDEISTAGLKSEDFSRQLNSVAQAEGALSEDLSRLDNDIYDMRQGREKLLEQRKELWRAENKLESSLVTMREEASICERELQGAMDKSTLQGLDAVRRISTQLGLTGFHGALYELFEVDSLYRTATETIAGSSLFHVVVDNDATASRLLEELVREKAGRVTFMPLNRLRPKQASFPTANGNDDAVPLLQQLRFSACFEPAMRQVFGKAMVCKDLSVGAALARSAGLTAITLAGDCADKKGALSGGFSELRGSKLDLASKWRQWSGKLSEHQRLLTEVKTKLGETERQINRLVGEIEQRTCRRDELRRTGTGEAELIRRELAALKELVSVKEKAKASLESNVVSLKSQIESMRAEVGTPLTSKLSSEETAELNALIHELESLRLQLSGLSAKVNEMAMQSAALETELEMNSRKRRHDLQITLARISSVTASREAEILSKELRHVRTTLDDCLSKSGEHSTKINSLNTNSSNIQNTLERARSNYDEAMRSASGQHHSMERYMTKRAAFIERREDLSRKIRDLAYAPDSSFSELRDQPETHLLRQLHRITEELRIRFAHVNKKAHEQYANFHKQGDALRERQEELIQSAEAIDDFIRVLDRRKDEAIERTFQQVSKGFSEVFEKLVPLGRGSLVMIRTGAASLPADCVAGKDSMEVDGGNALQYSGVAIRISFNSKNDEGLLMSQLSGGQKSLVALALIFAIQSCDPAPFYLFDEIDANLDAAYRTAVSSMICELKANAQFITTTFRPELLEHAESFFGVSFGGRVSRVESITREQALQFVESDPLAGPVATAGTR